MKKKKANVVISEDQRRRAPERPPDDNGIAGEREAKSYRREIQVCKCTDGECVVRSQGVSNLAEEKSYRYPPWSPRAINEIGSHFRVASAICGLRIAHSRKQIEPTAAPAISSNR